MSVHVDRRMNPSGVEASIVGCGTSEYRWMERDRQKRSRAHLSFEHPQIDSWQFASLWRRSHVRVVLDLDDRWWNEDDGQFIGSRQIF